MQVLMIRHGRPETRNGDFDPNLCDVGRKQARDLSAFLFRSGVARLVSSPLRRALQTAEPTAQALGLDVAVIHGLAEADRFGTSYRSVEELRREPAVWGQFLADPVGFLGADPVAFRREVLSAFEAVLASGAAKVAVFTHGLPINVVLSHALGLDRITHFVPHYCSISRLNGDSLDRLSVVSVNETTFLDS
jgi:2,3-bisphosphoglycerate-dependent phosphoglycerate mutase